MMPKRSSCKALLAVAAWGAMVFGTVSALTPSAQAAWPPGPLCGPDLLWVCTGPGGPKVLFAGTVCDRFRFEKQTGLTCVPYGG